MSPLVFISHASADRKLADAICVALEHRGIPCWIATRDVPLGMNFGDEIVSAISRCKIMVLVFSVNANNSNEIKKEVVFAGKCGLSVIPLRLEDVEPKGAYALELGTRQWIDLFIDWDNAIDKLVSHIRLALGHTGTGPIEPPAQETQDTPTRPAGATVPNRPDPQGSRDSSVPPPPQSGNDLAQQPKSRSRWAGPSTIAAVLVAVVIVVLKSLTGRPHSPAASPTVADSGTPSTAASMTSKADANLRRRDYGDALIGYQQAAQLGSSDAESRIGWIYQNGFGVPRDYSQALIWYQKAAEHGSAVGQYNVGYVYQNNLGVPRDYAQALDWYRRAANQGLAAAQYSVGSFYQRGLGVSQNYAQAMMWYQKAAEQGFADAENSIGFIYDNGLGVSQDYAQAMRWYEKAAGHGSSTAAYNLGNAYEYHRGVTQDYAQAMTWYQKAANQGLAAAQNSVGFLFQRGLGVTQDYAQAMTWYQRAAAQGMAIAQTNVGFLFQNGLGVGRDYAQAMTWYERAAQQRLPPAIFAIGLLYTFGLGVPQDCGKARSFMQDAANLGLANAKSWLQAPSGRCGGRGN